MDEKDVMVWVAPVIRPNGEIRQTLFDDKEQALQACMTFEREAEKIVDNLTPPILTPPPIDQR